MTTSTAVNLDELLDAARRGVALCRAGDWDEGLDLLGFASQARQPVDLPSTVYSFLGYGRASRDGRHREGLALCEFAIKAGALEPENYSNLARTLLLMDRRGEALGIVNRGLALSSRDDDLLQIRLSLGLRRSPVLPFLGRSNPLNRLLGRLRNSLRQA